ncbi:short-chain dehydrogenase [Filobacillus milosensis]|uniref:Short-chain dehydrogenase n=1 Tax=Filobacillus milosensis TaxID=94137 RepID=A0A4Y8IWZ8_9BACI|nr:short-chain dehydrogenase [Filobacillus milosensis]TFB23885.1 short-chain dehydrogenase [Filobacillus milosensis]
MEKGVSYLLALIITSIILFIIVANIFNTDSPTIAFLLSMIVSHFILEKNEWIIGTINRGLKWWLSQ